LLPTADFNQAIVNLIQGAEEILILVNPYWGTSAWGTLGREWRKRLGKTGRGGK